MFNLDTLDTIIAVVVVLLVLSLVVQSIQSLIKKLLKLKSRQLEESLLDLFESVLSVPKLQLPEERINDLPAAGVPKEIMDKLKGMAKEVLTEDQFLAKLKEKIGESDLGRRLPGGQELRDMILHRVHKLKNDQCANRLRMPTLQLFTKHPAESASQEVKELFNDVMKEFQEIGRVSGSKRRMLDSISKEDLMKVLRRVGPTRLLPKFINQIEAGSSEFKSLQAALNEVKKASQDLSGETNAKFAKLKELLTPILNDLQLFFKGDQSINKELLLADVLNLREVKFGEVFDLLGGVQQKVEADRDAAVDAAQRETLNRLSINLQKIATHLADLHEKLDAALVPLRLKLGEIENWYDTVMQSFEERYHRGMKTYAFVISMIVAIALNANIFNIYRDVAAQPEKRAVIVKMGEQISELHKQRITAEEKKVENAEAAINNADIPEKRKSLEEAAIKTKDTAKQNIEQILKDAKAELDKNAASYREFGFTPLKSDWEELKSVSGFWATGWRLSYMILGWLLMAALLSVGAPFWQDALESLFGIKNLLRKRGDIKNVEHEAGAGQPKT